MGLYAAGISSTTPESLRHSTPASGPPGPSWRTSASQQLAESFPRLLKVDGLDLHVADLDAIDVTPIYDLAPYFKEMGPRGEVREPKWPAEMLEDYWARTVF